MEIQKAVFDFNGNILKGDIKSKTARRLIREWVNLYAGELMENWNLARNDKKIKKISPLD
ncbi:MAG: DUF4160 domain-containing protein [Deltaproteobacteria bacterium]|nr:DUF4160 domain-containing protein [Deltaproteobacteria bacterium]MBW2164990.1 DUF4160 domain-containing protein [Deltaproteobacteria bacterium]